MLELAQKIAAKPSDKTIRIVRGVFALLLILVITLGWKNTFVEFGLPEFLKGILFIFPLIGLVRALLDPGIFRKKVWKWFLVGTSVSMILISLILIEDTPVTQSITSSTTISGELDINSLVTEQVSAPGMVISTDFWFAFFGWVLLFTALLLNGKNITAKNERFGEKITKIRV